MRTGPLICHNRWGRPEHRQDNRMAPRRSRMPRRFLMRTSASASSRWPLPAPSASQTSCNSLAINDISYPHMRGADARCTCRPGFPRSSSTLRTLTGEQLCLLRACLHFGETADLRPALYQSVVGQRIGGPLLTLAHGVQPVAEFAGRSRPSRQACAQARQRKTHRLVPSRG